MIAYTVNTGAGTHRAVWTGGSSGEGWKVWGKLAVGSRWVLHAAWPGRRAIAHPYLPCPAGAKQMAGGAWLAC